MVHPRCCMFKVAFYASILYFEVASFARGVLGEVEFAMRWRLSI